VGTSRQPPRRRSPSRRRWSAQPAKRTSPASRTPISMTRTHEQHGDSHGDPLQADLAVSKDVSNPTPNVGDTITLHSDRQRPRPEYGDERRCPGLSSRGPDLRLGDAERRDVQREYGCMDRRDGDNDHRADAGDPSDRHGPSPLTNRAAISHSDQYDPNPSNNTASVLETPQLSRPRGGQDRQHPTPNVGRHDQPTA